jgi:hypothetical protein
VATGRTGQEFSGKEEDNDSSRQLDGMVVRGNVERKLMAGRKRGGTSHYHPPG